MNNPKRTSVAPPFLNEEPSQPCDLNDRSKKTTPPNQAKASQKQPFHMEEKHRPPVPKLYCGELEPKSHKTQVFPRKKKTKQNLTWYII